jgi:hypothetical protein
MTGTTALAGPRRAVVMGCRRRSSIKASVGEIATDSRPAATRAAALARLTTPSASPI